MLGVFIPYVGIGLILVLWTRMLGVFIPYVGIGFVLVLVDQDVGCLYILCGYRPHSSIGA